MELSWFPFSILSLLIFGIWMAFYKFPAAKKYNRFVTNFWSIVSMGILALIFFHSYLPLSTAGMIWTALLWGITFTCIALLQMYALSHVDTNVLFPVTTTSSLVVTVAIGIFFFHDHISLIQTLGIIIAILTIFLFVYKKGKLQYSNLLIAIGSGIIFISALNKVLQKIVADQFDIHAFQIYQYLFAALFSFVFYICVHRRDWKAHIFSGGFGVGSFMGIFGFFGGYFLLIALTKGPFPLITAISSLYIFVTALVGYFLFKEKLTKKKIFLVLLAILSVILIRLG